MYLYRPVIAGLTILFALIALPASANTGRVMSLSGDVKVNGSPMSKAHIVRAGDKITTGRFGRVNIVMSDKSVIDVRPGTTFKLERFKFDLSKPKQGGSSLMNLFRGSFRYISGLVGRNNPRNAAIKMGTATAGVRGSFATFSYADGQASVDVEVGTGTITFADGSTISIDRGQVGSVNVNTGASSASFSPSSNTITDVISSLQANPEDTESLQSLNDAEKALLVAVMVADQEALGIDPATLSTAVSTVTSTSPESAAVIAAVATATATDSGQAQALTDSIASTEGVDSTAVQEASDAAIDIFGDTGTTDTGTTDTGTSETGATDSGTTGTSGGGGGTASPSEP